MSSSSNATAARKREVPDEASDFPDALLEGLRAEPKRIPCKFFYDSEGSRLFEKISALPEYYLTRTELSLLSLHAQEFANLIGPEGEIVEFGAGSSAKIRALLNGLDRPRAYIPIDISGPYLKSVARALEADYPKLSVRPLVADFSGTLQPAIFSRDARRRIGFFPGSTIGNFAPEDAKRFLSDAARLLKGGGLLIGVDLVKDPAILHAAYNDSAGITALFNKNLLRRANRDAEANFDIARFAHYAPYNPVARRIEMYLVSTATQRVTVCGRSIHFAEGEAIETEWSYKYSVDDFRALSIAAGFVPRKVWCDEDRLFSLHWLEAP